MKTFIPSKERWLACLSLVSLFLVPLGTFATSSASQPSEFPNYFAELPPEIAQEKIHKAIDSVLRRLQVPYVDGDGKIRSDGFYLKLNEIVTQEDPQAQAYISGGVVRSLLGYIYQKIYSAKLKDPHADVGQILDKIITRDKQIPSLNAMGIGSDLDILVDSSNPTHHSKEKATQFINSAQTKLELLGTVSKLKYAIVPVADVNDYHVQIGETTSQGGSCLDWLAFPLPRKDGQVGSIREPDGSSHIMEHFLKGEYDYLPPNGKIEVKDKQTVRGLRPLLEMPFLRLTPSGEHQMVKELTELKNKVSQGHVLSNGALEQFGKLIRNARFEGGHNRFHISEDQLEKTALEISNLSAKNDKNLPLIPEFLEHKDPKSRKHQELPAGLHLLPVDKFIQKYTNNGEGTLYHGTPKLDFLLSMIRNGMVISDSKQGRARLGRGTYTTGDYSIATAYSGIDGAVISMPIKKEMNPRILNMDDPDIQTSLALAKIKKEAETQGRDLNEYLFHEYGIDIIVNEYVLIQNAAVLRTPKKLIDLVELSALDANKNIAEYDFLNPLRSNDKKKKLSNFISYLHLAKALQIPIKTISDSIAKSLILKLRDFKSNHPEIELNIMNFLAKLSPDDPDVQFYIYSIFIRMYGVRSNHEAEKIIRELNPSESVIHNAIANALEDSNLHTRETVLNNLKELNPTDTATHQLIAKAIKDSNSSVRVAALEALGEIKTNDPIIHQEIAKAIKDSDSYVQEAALKALGEIKTNDPTIHREIAKALTHSIRRVRITVLNTLGKIKPTDPVIHLAIAKALKTSGSGSTSFGEQELQMKIRIAAFSALGEIKPTDPKIHHAIAKFINDKYMSWVQQNALEALGKIKPTDPAIHHAIAKALLSGIPSVRSSAEETLQSILPRVSNAKTYLLILESGRLDLLKSTEEDPRARTELICNLILETQNAGAKEKQAMMSALHHLHVDEAQVATLKEKAEHDALECHVQKNRLNPLKFLKHLMPALKTSGN